jgi:hypothetical protein
VDLRWQRSNQQSGFEGIKDIMPLRDAHGNQLADFWPSWSKWASLDRDSLQKAAFSVEGWSAQDKDEFDTTVAGPWIGRWTPSRAK